MPIEFEKLDNPRASTMSLDDDDLNFDDDDFDSPSVPVPSRANKSLSAFYGLATAANAATNSNNQADDASLDIDSSSFDPRAYMNNLLSKCSLAELMQEHSALFSAKQTLDTAMQRLVYENYSTFITATDTIRDMQTQMKSVDVWPN